MMGNAGPACFLRRCSMPSGVGTNRRQGVFRYTSYEGAGFGFLYTLPAHNGGCCGSLNRPWRPRGILARSGHPNHHGNNAGAAIVGGSIGLGIGAAIASRGYYAPPPPVYYGAPPGYYAPPPAVYYGY